MLYRKGANLNDKNKELLTPLHVAVDKSHYDVIDVLLKCRGTKVNALDSGGNTALHRAARSVDFEQFQSISVYFGRSLSISVDFSLSLVNLNGYLSISVYFSLFLSVIVYFCHYL